MTVLKVYRPSPAIDLEFDEREIRCVDERRRYGRDIRRSQSGRMRAYDIAGQAILEVVVTFQLQYATTIAKLLAMIAIEDYFTLWPRYNLDTGEYHQVVLAEPNEIPDPAVAGAQGALSLIAVRFLVKPFGYIMIGRHRRVGT